MLSLATEDMSDGQSAAWPCSAERPPLCGLHATKPADRTGLAGSARGAGNVYAVPTAESKSPRATSTIPCDDPSLSISNQA